MTINSLQLTEYLTSHHDAVLDILNDLGFTDINHNKQKHQVRFSREEGRNPSSVLLNLNTLAFKCFSDSSKGNLYTLVMTKKNLYFSESLDYIADIIGLEKSEFNRKIELPFGGFFKTLVQEIQEPEYAMMTYNEDILSSYLNKYNMMFFNDGICYDTQREFKIGYDLETNSILIPEYTLDGKLCGVQARANDLNCEHDKRWWAWLPCSRSLTLYGYHKNYQKIQEKGLCIITESEKSIMQMYGFGSQIGLGLCGNGVSETQAKYIKGLLVPKIILGLDEGLDETYVQEEAKKLIVDNPVYKNSVGYIYDADNEILPKGSKASPTDLGRDKFAYLIKRKVRWLE